MSVLEVFASFHLELLPEEWVNNAWKADFYDVQELPGEYELQIDEADFSELISNLIETIEGWNVDDKPSNSSEILMAIPKTWSALVENGVDYKAFLCLLSVFMRSKKKPTIDVLKTSLISSRLYFVLLSIPGAHAFNIFNPILFHQSLQLFTDLMSYGCLEKNKVRTTCSKKNKPQNVSDNNDTIGHTLQLSDDEKDMIFIQVSLLLNVLSDSLSVLHLKDDEESLAKTIQVLVSLTQLVEDNKNVFDTVPSNNCNESISRKCFLILEQLCSSNHGDIQRIIFKILQYILQTIIIREEDIKMAIKGHGSLNVNVYIFIKRLLQIHERNAVPAVKALIQQLCVRLPDRTDIRSKALPQIIQLLQLFKYNVFQEFAVWLVSLAHNEKAKHRLSAIELIAKLLNASEITNFVEENQTRNTESDENRSIPKSGFVNYSIVKNEKILTKFLIGAILSRSLDISVIVRSKSLNILASLVFSNLKVIKEIMEELKNKQDPNPPLKKKISDFPFYDYQDYLSTKAEKGLIPIDPLPPVISIFDIVIYLTCNLNVYVRKNALLVLLNMCLYNKVWLEDSRIKIFVQHCSDVSLMVRKFSAKCLTDLLIGYPLNDDIINAWVNGVVPLASDNDVKVQEKAIELIGNVILNNLREYSDESNELSNLPWQVLIIVTKNLKRKHFKGVCQYWAKNDILTQTVLKNIESHIGTENNTNAWFLIVCISEYQDYPEPEFIADYFSENIWNKIEDDLSAIVNEALFLNWSRFSEQTQEEIHLKLKGSVDCFKVPITMISRYLDICFMTDKEGTKNWCRKLVQKCEEYLRSNVAPGCSPDFDEVLLCRYIHTLGDACHFHPGVHADIINYLVDLIDPTSITRGMTLKWRGTATSVVKAISIVTLGKICLQDQFIAQTYAPVFAGVLVESSTINIKNNAMVALADLCVRFTSVVEGYIGDMCVMLRDSDPDVRLHCLKLLVDLLQEDYLKPKGALFFYLLFVLNDSDPEIRRMIDCYVTNVLLKRNPSIMSHYFIQAIYFLNDYEGVGCFNKDSIPEKERRIFSMVGMSNFCDRGMIYRYMLSKMRDDHRFKLSNRICTDILDEVIEGNIPLNRVGSSVLKDALYSMACDEMRLEHMRKGIDDSSDKELEDAMLPEHNGDEVMLGFAKKVFLSQIVKTNYVEYIVPTISKLKRILAEKKSILVRDLMLTLRELMKDFKEEINDILHSDPELAAEVSWDMKQISREEEFPPEIIDEFNLKELRVRCERLTITALTDKMGINISSMMPWQAQPAENSTSENTGAATSHSKLPSPQDQSSKLSYEKRRRSRRNYRLRSRNSVQKSHLGENSNELANNPTSSKSSPGIIAEELDTMAIPGPSSSCSFKKTFGCEKSSSEISWTPSFHSSPNVDKSSSKTTTSLDSECSTSCSVKSSVSSGGSSSGVKKKQNRENVTGKLKNQAQDAGPSQPNRSSPEKKNVPSTSKFTKEKKRTKGKRK